MLWNNSLLETLPPASLHLISSWKPASLELIFWLENWPFLTGLTGDSCLCFCHHPRYGSLSHWPSSHSSLTLPSLPQWEILSRCVHEMPELLDSPSALMWPADSVTPTCCPLSPSLCCCIQGQTVSFLIFWERASVLMGVTECCLRAQFFYHFWMWSSELII